MDIVLAESYQQPPTPYNDHLPPLGPQVVHLILLEKSSFLLEQMKDYASCAAYAGGLSA